MTRKAHHAHIECEVLAAELRAVSAFVRRLQHSVLELDVAERPPVLVPFRGQVVQVPRRGELHGLQAGLGRGSSDHEDEVVGRTGRRADRLHLLGEELLKARGVQERFRLLVEVGLVGRSPALGHEKELVLHPAGGIEIDLGGEVRPRVLLVVHLQCHRLRIPQALVPVCLVDPARQPLFVPDPGPHFLPLFADHRRRAGVLTERENERGRDFGVPQHGHRYAPIVGGGLGIDQYGGHLLEMRGPEEKRHITKRLAGKEGQRLRRYLEHILALEARDGNVVLRDQTVSCGVGAEGEGLLVDEVGHDGSSVRGGEGFSELHASQ